MQFLKQRCVPCVQSLFFFFKMAFGSSCAAFSENMKRRECITGNAAGMNKAMTYPASVICTSDYKQKLQAVEKKFVPAMTKSKPQVADNDNNGCGKRRKFDNVKLEDYEQYATLSKKARNHDDAEELILSTNASPFANHIAEDTSEHVLNKLINWNDRSYQPAKTSGAYNNSTPIVSTSTPAPHQCQDLNRNRSFISPIGRRSTVNSLLSLKNIQNHDTCTNPKCLENAAKLVTLEKVLLRNHSPIGHGSVHASNKEVRNDVVELVSGSGVSISEVKKKIILFQTENSRNPSVLMRLLIEHFFKDEQLAHSTATNKGPDKQRALNPTIVLAIQTFVLRYAEHVGRHITIPELNKIIGNKISSVRRKLALMKKSETLKENDAQRTQ